MLTRQAPIILLIVQVAHAQEDLNLHPEAGVNLDGNGANDGLDRPRGSLRPRHTATCAS